MNPLTFNQEEPIEDDEIRGDWKEYGEKLMKLLDENLKDRPALFEFFNEAILDSDFLDTPFGGKGRGKMLGGLCVRTLTVIDHCLALNEAWDLAIKPEQVLVACVLRAMPLGGCFKLRGKYIKKVAVTIRTKKVTWVKNTSFDNAESFAVVLEHLIKAKDINSQEILTLMPSVRSPLAWLVHNAEDYVDHFTEV